MVNPIVACSQISCSWDQDENINKAEKIITDAVKEGVNIFLLQELFSSPYFCSSQDPKFFKLAQPFENNYLIEKFSKIASKLSVVLPISFFEKDKNSYYNSVAIIDSNGEVLGKYRKSHIPQNPGYEEKYYFPLEIVDLKYGKQVFVKLVLVFVGINGFQNVLVLWL